MSTTQSPGSAAMAYPSRGLPLLACHWPVPAELPHFCSCGDLDCPHPARHPISTLTRADATQDRAQLSRWWTAHPAANLATVTDTARLGVIELRHPARPDHVMRLLNAHQIQPCPVLHAGPGQLQFLVQPDLSLAAHPQTAIDPTYLAASDGGGTLICRSPGTLVPLPPSRLMIGERLRWMRRLHQHIARLPLAAVLLGQLADVVKTGALDDPYPLLVS